jgi:hypothetical protein
MAASRSGKLRGAKERKLLALTNKLRLDEAKRGGANALVEWEEAALHELLALRSEDVEPYADIEGYRGSPHKL